MRGSFAIDRCTEAGPLLGRSVVEARLHLYDLQNALLAKTFSVSALHSQTWALDSGALYVHSCLRLTNLEAGSELIWDVPFPGCLQYVYFSDLASHVKPLRLTRV